MGVIRVAVITLESWQERDGGCLSKVTLSQMQVQPQISFTSQPTSTLQTIRTLESTGESL